MAFQSMAAPNCNYKGSFLVLHSQSVYVGVGVNIEREYYFGCRGKESSSKFFLSWSESLHGVFHLYNICCLGEQASGREARLAFSLTIDNMTALSFLQASSLFEFLSSLHPLQSDASSHVLLMHALLLLLVSGTLPDICVAQGTPQYLLWRRRQLH